MDSPIQLSSDELAALERGEPLRLLANETQPVVLVLAEQYDRLKQCGDFADADPQALPADRGRPARRLERCFGLSDSGEIVKVSRGDVVLLDFPLTGSVEFQRR
jgi:hypothetical protein